MYLFKLSTVFVVDPLTLQTHLFYIYCHTASAIFAFLCLVEISTQNMLHYVLIAPSIAIWWNNMISFCHIAPSSE